MWRSSYVISCDICKAREYCIVQGFLLGGSLSIVESIYFKVQKGVTHGETLKCNWFYGLVVEMKNLNWQKKAKVRWRYTVTGLVANPQPFYRLSVSIAICQQ